MDHNLKTIKCFINELLNNNGKINQTLIEKKYNISHATIRKYFKILKKVGYIDYKKCGKYKYIERTVKFNKNRDHFKFMLKFLDEIEKLL